MNNIQKYIGNISQIGGVRPYELTDGWSRKMRAYDVNTGSGLQYTVLPDRGMDISLASFKGNNLVYLTCNGETSPSYYEPEGIGWLHTFAGGLLTTCGLTHFGPPSDIKENSMGLHGRYSTIPARQVADSSEWIDSDYHIKLKGIVEEGALFGNKLRSVREITSVIGTNALEITDTITNFGSRSSPYMILYHFNFGYPMLSKEAELLIEPQKTEPRDKNAETGMKEFKEFIDPQMEYDEQVFFHQMKGDPYGFTTVSLINKNVGIKLTLSFNIKQLPYLTQWKMMGYGEYVLGLEPCNVVGKLRKQLIEESKLPFLDPQETVSNKIKIRLEEI
jgi:hypothetical protein